MTELTERSTTPTRPAPGLLVWVALGVVYLVWGSTYLGIRVVVRTLPPLGAMGARFLLAGLLMAAFVRVRGGRGALHAPAAHVRSAVLVGVLLLAGGNGVVAVAEKTVPSGLAALMVAAMPLWLVLLRTVARDRPRALTLTGTFVGFAGIAVLARPGGHGSDVKTWGILLLLLATLSWATGTFLSPRLPMPASPFLSTSIEMLAGGVLMLVASPLLGELRGFSFGHVQASAWWALLYLVFVGSLLAFTAFVWLAQNAPLSLVSTYAFVNPVVAVFLGWAILGESLTASIVAGGALAVLGVFLVVRSERRPAPA